MQRWCALLGMYACTCMMVSYQGWMLFFFQSDMHVPTLAIYDRKIYVHLCMYMYISYTSSFGCSMLSSGFINIPGINVTLLCTLHHTRYYNVQTLNQYVYIYIYIYITTQPWTYNYHHVQVQVHAYGFSLVAVKSSIEYRIHTVYNH